MYATIIFPFFPLNYTNDFYLDLGSGYIGVYWCKKKAIYLIIINFSSYMSIKILYICIYIYTLYVYLHLVCALIKVLKYTHQTVNRGYS